MEPRARSLEERVPLGIGEVVVFELLWQAVTPLLRIPRDLRMSSEHWTEQLDFVRQQ